MGALMASPFYINLRRLLPLIVILQSFAFAQAAQRPHAFRMRTKAHVYDNPIYRQ